MSTETKEGLLVKAKKSIEAGDKAWRDAAEALVKAGMLGATQEEMAEAVGKSQTWVSRLLKWQREGYKEENPFGPTTKAARYAHANKNRGRKNRGKGGKQPPLTAVPPRPDADSPKDTVGVDLDKAKSIIRTWFALMTNEQKSALVAFVMQESGQPIRLAA
jgi:hypothetical protein